MQRLRIAIDPALKRRFGPEISWAWRLVLSGIGFPWEEVVGNGTKCDIAYVRQGQRTDHCRVAIYARPEFWEQRAELRFGAMGRADGWPHPVYVGESPGPELIQVADGRLICTRDLVFDVFWLATGQEERHCPADTHGHFDLGGGSYAQQALRVAIGSGIASQLQKTLLNLGFADALPRWPNGKRAAACVSHDVDYPEVVRWLEPLRILRRRGLGGLGAAVSVLNGTRNHWHIPSWVQRDRSLNTRSAFYFVARQGSPLQYAFGTPDPFYDVRSQRFRALFEYLTDEGFEIGMHASYRAFESREKFASEKEALQKASGQKIRGNRHHYWHLSPRDPESTLLMHEQIGLEYDSSLTHERYVGWRRGLSWPFFPFHQKTRRELSTLQIPTAWMDDQLFGHRGDNPGDRQEILQDLTDRTADQGGCLLIDIHDYVFDDALFPGWASTYSELWKYVAASADFWIDTPARIAGHWRTRYGRITQASRGLTSTEGSS